MVSLFGNCFKKPFAIKGHRGFSRFFSKSFKALPFTFKSTTYLGFTRSMRKRTNIILPIQIIKYPRTTYSPSARNATFVHYQIPICVGLYLFGSINLSILEQMTLSQSLCYKESLDTCQRISSRLIFLLFPLPNPYTVYFFFFSYHQGFPVQC